MKKNQLSTTHISLRKKFLIITICTLCFSLINTFCAGEKESANDDGWIKIFNGRDLEGWKVKITGYELNENFGNTFRVEDGILKVSYNQYKSFDENFGHIFYKDKFSHYILRLEYRCHVSLPVAGKYVKGSEVPGLD